MGRRLLVSLLLLLMLGTLFSGCTTDTESGGGVQQIAAPDFALPDLNGSMVTLGGLRGRPVLLNFWASWCGPCRGEMPYLQAVSEDTNWQAQGLAVIAVNLGEGRETAAEFIEVHSYSFTTLIDTEGLAGQAYNIRNIPATFFIDENGIIKGMHIGPFSSKAEIDQRLINTILKD
ncbi:peroxiredoxin family protein [Chloroflexota bacterium]